MSAEPPEYDREYTMGESPVWDLPADVIATAENDTQVKICLLDTHDLDIVHCDKEVLEMVEWDSVEEFREDVEWGAYE